MKISYDSYENDIVGLAEKLKEHRPQRLIGVAKGGLVVACHLSYILNTEVFAIHKNLQGIYYTLSQMYSTDIIIDDFIDSGETYRNIRDSFDSRFLFASLYSKIPIKDAIIGSLIETEEYVHLPYQQPVRG